MKSKQYYALYQEGKTLDEIFDMLMRESNDLVEMRKSKKSNKFPTNAFIAAYKDQNNKAKSIINHINADTGQSVSTDAFVKYVYAKSPEMAAWVFPKEKPEAKIKVDWWFSYLIKGTFPVSRTMTEGQIERLRVDFEKYINSLNLTDRVISEIIPKNLIEVLSNVGHPLRKNGFHPALSLHLVNFVEEGAEMKRT